MIIIFEGVDKSGKTSLIKEVHKLTNYKYPILDRFTGSSVAYNIHRQRGLKLDYYQEIEKQMFDNVILFYITASKDVISKRCIETNERDIEVEEIEKIKKCYEHYLENISMFKFFVIDTSESSLEECAKIIIKHIDEEENIEGINKIYRLIELIKNRGESISGTLELKDLKIDIGDIKRFDINSYEFKMKNEDDEKAFYDRIYNDLRHLIISQIKEYNQNLNSRRFNFYSNECINAFHLLFRDNKLEVFINLRSSDVIKNLPLDVYYSYEIINRLNKEFFKVIEKNIRINFHFDSAHIYEEDLNKDIHKHEDNKDKQIEQY